MSVALTSMDDVISNFAPYLSHAASSDLSSAVPVTDGGDVEALALLFLLWLGTEPRICKTATKSASLSWRARFFKRERRFSAFFKSLWICCFLSFIVFCFDFKRAMALSNASDSNKRTVTLCLSVVASDEAAKGASAVLEAISSSAVLDSWMAQAVPSALAQVMVLVVQLGRYPAN